jgi:hypothetical protein
LTDELNGANEVDDELTAFSNAVPRTTSHFLISLALQSVAE